MEEELKKKVTVQGVMTPVPAARSSEQAGSLSPIYSNRNDMAVAHLAAMSDTSTSYYPQHLPMDTEGTETVDDETTLQPFYRLWQCEKTAREKLEKLVASLQESIKKLERRVSKPKPDFDTTASTSTNIPNPPPQVQYFTDDEELQRETDWILKKNKKRPSKKRKMESSPETPAQNQIIRSKPIEAKESVSASPPNRPKQKKDIPPPPILVHNVNSFNKLKNIVAEATNAEYKFASHNNNVWKINVTDRNAYRCITETLSTKAIEWHSYEDKSNRPIKVMVRGLHPSCDPEEICSDLTSKGFNILQAVNIIKKERKEVNGIHSMIRSNLPLFMLTFHNDEDIQKIYAIKSINHILVKVEPLRKLTNKVTQCKKCQSFGHTKHYCNRIAACVKCAGNHSSQSCTLPRESDPKCVNCRENHPANYRGCIVAKEHQKLRNKANSSNRFKTTNNQANKVPTEEIQHVGTSSYSQIVKNARNEEQSSIKDILSNILQRLNDQDKALQSLSEELSRVKVRPHTK
jgi:Associated with zinc fingers